jgi:hypothetical protein
MVGAGQRPRAAMTEWTWCWEEQSRATTRFQRPDPRFSYYYRRKLQQSWRKTQEGDASVTAGVPLIINWGRRCLGAASVDGAIHAPNIHVADKKRVLGTWARPFLGRQSAVGGFLWVQCASVPVRQCLASRSRMFCWGRYREPLRAANLSLNWVSLDFAPQISWQPCQMRLAQLPAAKRNHARAAVWRLWRFDAQQSCFQLLLPASIANWQPTPTLHCFSVFGITKFTRPFSNR